LLKLSAAVAANIPTDIRDSLFSAIKKSNLLPSLNDSLDFDFDNYNALIEAPTVAKGAKAIGMNKLSEWLYRPRHYSTVKSEYTDPLCRPILFIPGLKIKPFYPPNCKKDFSWLDRLEAATPIIREEFLKLTESNPKAVGTYLIPEDMTSTVKGWRTFFLVNPHAPRRGRS
jgi:hypothetical protein